MSININSCIESLSNPNGRFRTLEGIYPVTGNSDELIMSVEDISVDFEVIIGGQHYILKCILSRDQQVIDRLKEIATFTNLIQSAFLTEFVYLEKELLVFDSADKHRYLDVVIERIPSAKRIDHYVSHMLREQIELPVKALLRGIVELIRWIDNTRFSHGRLSPKTVWIDTLTQQPILSNYSQSSRNNPVQDIRGLGVVAIGFYILGCEPRFFTIPRVMDSDSGWDSRRRFLNMLPTITDLTSNGGLVHLKTLIDILNRGATDRLVVEELCHAIEELALSPLQRIDKISDLVEAHDKQLQVGAYGVALDLTNWAGRSYQFVGQISNMLMRVFDGRRWYYIDKRGDVVLNGDYIYANDFYEGLAVVETATGYGLIDTQGQFVIEPNCDDIEYDTLSNIVIVTRNGSSGLYSPDGQSVTGLIYDQIINSSEELILVKKNRRFGYIRRDGSVAIELIYEDAFSFKDGITRVRLDGKDYIIDSAGVIISETASKNPVV